MTYELRKDPLLNRWVAVALAPLQPSGYFIAPRMASEQADCPVCAGRLDNVTARHPIERSIRSVRPPQALMNPSLGLNRRSSGMYDIMNASGYDELIIESPIHESGPEDLPPAHMEHLVQFYRDRFLAASEDQRMRYVLIAMDSDPRAGASLNHPHSRLIATPIIPHRIKTELDGAREYFAYKERCCYCDMMDEALETGHRVIAMNETFLAFTPYAPRYPFELWIAPIAHQPSFGQIEAGDVPPLAALLRTALRRIRGALGDPPVSFVIHSSVNNIPGRDAWRTMADDYHWHIEIMPRIRRTSGLESGSGLYILTTSPEAAAHYLKED